MTSDLWQSALAWLRSPALQLWGVDIAWSEVAGDLTGVLCVWLVARQSMANWPLGLANNVFWAVLFSDAKLYADALLQGVFFLIGIYGWYSWVWGATGSAPMPVRTATLREMTVLGTLTVLATAAVAAWLHARTDSPVPFWDASVLTLSLLATWGQARKLLESWWIWIAVDLISVPLYLSRGLYPTALVYVLFGVLCIVGLLDWKRSVQSA